MASSGDIQKAHTHKISDSKLHEFLQSELNKKKDLKDARSKLNTNNESDNYNMIYKLKLEKSKGDSLFSSVSDSYGRIGTTLGVRTSLYLDQVRRYEKSKELLSEATQYQRNQIRNFTNCLFKMIWRSRFNYAVKGGLATIFLYNLCRANENRNLYLLRNAHPKSGEIAQIYYNSAVSGVFAFLTFILF